VASTRVQGWGGEVPKGVVCGEGCSLPRIFFCFVMSKWRILVYSGVLKLKYVMILGESFQLTSPKPKYRRGCFPGIPGGVDTSGANNYTTPPPSYLAVDSTHTAVERFRSLDRRSGSRCLTSSEIRRVVLRLLNIVLKDNHLLSLLM